MIFDWESEEARLKQFMKISPKKKMEWLREMQKFTIKTTSKRERKLRLKLREIL